MTETISPDPNDKTSTPRPARHLPTLAAVVSGALLATCYWPLDLHLVAWIALVPWLLVLPKVPVPRVWSLGTLLGVVFYGPGFAWLCRLQPILGLAAVLGLAVWMGFGFRVARLLVDRFTPAALLWAAPLAFVGQELLRSEALPRYRFAYLGLGYSQSSSLWIAQMASLGGVYLVSFLLVAFNAALVYALTRRTRRAWIWLATVTALIAGLGVASQPAARPAGAEVAVACVQAESYVLHDYYELTAQALERPAAPSLVVLPEHTVVDFPNDDHHFIKQLGELARRHEAYICVGAHVEPPAGSGCPFDNVALLVGPEGRIVARQAKAVPVPFFIDGVPATSQPVINTKYGPAGILVCYDGTFTDLPRRLVARGAELLLVPVMDPEPWPVQQRWQHAAMAPFRSIETRRWAVRAASSGVSQIIAPDGTITQQRSRSAGPGVISGLAAFRSDQTVFVKGGYLFAPIVGISFLVVVCWLTIVDWRSRSSAGH